MAKVVLKESILLKLYSDNFYYIKKFSIDSTLSTKFFGQRTERRTQKGFFRNIIIADFHAFYSFHDL